MLTILKDAWYEFHIKRVVSRAGQPILVKYNVEIGPLIGAEEAAQQVRNGKDVYTLLERNAKKLAAKNFSAPPDWEPPHKPSHFQHYHPGGEHPLDALKREGRPRARVGPGHVFFGNRGEKYKAEI